MVLKVERCRKCAVELIEGENWSPSCARHRSRICKSCHSKQVSERRRQRKLEEVKADPPEKRDCNHCGEHIPHQKELKSTDRRWSGAMIYWKKRVCYTCSRLYRMREKREKLLRSNKGQHDAVLYFGQIGESVEDTLERLKSEVVEIAEALDRRAKKTSSDEDDLLDSKPVNKF